jgi:hypothetical protein
MSSYVLPQVRVFQDFETAVEADVRDLNAFICGGHAYLVRLAEADEKALGYLGVYDHVGSLVDGEYKTCYSWPQKPVGSVIDEEYTAVAIDNALLRYFRDTSHAMTKTARNKIRHPSKIFKTNGSTYPRSADFYDRDVAVGDIVVVSGIPTINDGTSSESEESRVTLSTYVKAIEADVVAAVVDTSPTSDSANQATQILAATSSAASGNSGTATINTQSGASYNGHADGDLVEVYTVTVIQASTGSDATTARLQVVSASGNDDDAEVTPATFGSPTSIGSRGLTATWSGASTAFTLGDVWTVTVHQAFTAPVPTTGGTYTGTVDKTYEIAVTAGGNGTSQITCTTTDGTDFSGPTTIASSATNYAVGTLGVVVQFSTATLRKGDRYYVTATAATAGAYRTLVLGHDLDSDIDLNDAASSDLEVDLYIKKNIEVDTDHVSVPGQFNWTQSNTELCLNAGIYAFDETYTNVGVPVALPVIKDTAVANSNKLYVQYRAWRSDLASAVNGIDDVANLNTAISGALSPDNPLKWGVYKALQNSNGQVVKYAAVADPTDSADWVSVIDLISDRMDVYGLVPLTRDATIIGLFEAHIGAASTEDTGRWRVLWVNLENEDNVAVVNAAASSNGQVVQVVTEDDPDTSGSQYTLFRITSGNAELIDLGVRPGDVVRYQYTVDSWGNASYTEYVVDEVLNETTLRVTGSGTDVAESVAKKAEIWRTLTVAEQATAIANAAGNYSSRRVRAIWPDTVSEAGTSMEGYYLCCALAGLSSGVAPHQPLTRVSITGFDDISRTTRLFNRSQLDELAAAGTWVVTQDPGDGEVYSRHAITTGNYDDINEREEQVTRNVDSMSYYWLEKFSPYIGVANNTPGMLDIIEAETRSGIEYLRSANKTTRLGGQLIDAEIVELRPSPVFSDRMVLTLQYTLPYALNNIDVHQLI